MFFPDITDTARAGRRMGVVVGYEPHGGSLDALRERTKAAAAKVSITERK